MASITSDDEIWTENFTISDLNPSHSPSLDEQTISSDRGSTVGSDYIFRQSRNVVINLQNREVSWLSQPYFLRSNKQTLCFSFMAALLRVEMQNPRLSQIFLKFL